jgi:hypothetical protein
MKKVFGEGFWKSSLWNEVAGYRRNILSSEEKAR